MQNEILVVCIDDGSHEILDDTEDLTPNQALQGNWSWTSDGHCPICAQKIEEE